MRIRAFWEAWHPLLLGFAIALPFPLIWPGAIDTGSCWRLAGICVWLFGLMIFLVLATCIILHTMRFQPFLRGMQQSGAFSQLRAYQRESMVWSFSSIICALLAGSGMNDSMHPMVASALMGLWTGAFFASARVLKLFAMTLRYSTSSDALAQQQ